MTVSGPSAILDRDRLEAYLSRFFQSTIRIRSMEPLGQDSGAKGFGYGAPVRLCLAGAPVANVVLHVAGPQGFGHDTLTDRAVQALLPYDTFNSFSGHVPAFDVGVLTGAGGLESLREVQDFFFVTGYAAGEPYYKDLERVAQDGSVTGRDRFRVDALVDVLVRNHRVRKDGPELYRRRVRDLFGHHESIAGLIDSYDAYDIEAYTTAGSLQALEQRGVRWRHWLKRYAHRLCQVHGDFHPWNVLFSEADQPVLLDRSRGEWGEPADDVACMAINYLFFSLRASGALCGGLAELWERFFTTYLDATGDDEILELIAPQLWWRALVLASPQWYPALDVDVRRQLFRFIDGVSKLEPPATFDWRHPERYLEPLA